VRDLQDRARTREHEVVDPRNELALRHGAGAEETTRAPEEAYAPYPRWVPGRPSFRNLPWAWPPARGRSPCGPCSSPSR
jgi:hypothetical protein